MDPNFTASYFIYDGGSAGGADGHGNNRTGDSNCCNDKNLKTENMQEPVSVL